MTTLLQLKVEYDTTARHPLRLTFAGALEAHLLAPEIGRAGVSVIVAPGLGRPFPGTWEMRRMCALPFSTIVADIHIPQSPWPASDLGYIPSSAQERFNVGIGIVSEYDARNARFDMAMVRDFRFTGLTVFHHEYNRLD